MPTYEYICENGHRLEVVRGIKENDTTAGFPCGEEGCDSSYEQTWSVGPGHSWPGGKPTPRFHR